MTKEGKRRLTVMSYNIQHGKGLDGVVDVERIAAVIREAGADLVGLQEVDRHFGERSRQEDQAKRLADILQLHDAYGANLDFDPEQVGGKRRQYGTLILSRFPIVEQRNHLLPLRIEPGDWNEQRGLLETHIDVDGTRIAFLNTHLGLHQKERALQVEQILRLPAMTQGKAILVGDMNATPNSDEMRALSGVLTDILSEQGYREAGTLWKTPKGKITPERSVRIDYIFASPSFDVQGAKIIPSTASDHLTITAEIEFFSKS